MKIHPVLMSDGRIVADKKCGLCEGSGVHNGELCYCLKLFLKERKQIKKQGMGHVDSCRKVVVDGGERDNFTDSPGELCGDRSDQIVKRKEGKVIDQTYISAV